MLVRPLDRKIDGPVIIEAKVFRDHRGYFGERFNETVYRDSGLPTTFTQVNQSKSLPGVLRGLHVQLNPPQGKLLWATAGKIFDVIVDVRPDSKSFLKSASIELDGTNPDLTLWVPEGFAHGFCVLGDQAAEVVYKMTAPYNPSGETGLNWNDPELAITWPVSNPILSERDKNLLSADEFRKKYKS